MKSNLCLSISKRQIVLITWLPRNATERKSCLAFSSAKDDLRHLLRGNPYPAMGFNALETFAGVDTTTYESFIEWITERIRNKQHSFLHMYVSQPYHSMYETWQIRVYKRRKEISKSSRKPAAPRSLFMLIYILVNSCKAHYEPADSKWKKYSENHDEISVTAFRLRRETWKLYVDKIKQKK